MVGRQLLVKFSVDSAHHIEPADIVGRIVQNFLHQLPLRADMGGAKFLGITFLLINCEIFVQC